MALAGSWGTPLTGKPRGASGTHELRKHTKVVQERARLRDAQGFVTLRRGDSDQATLNRDRPERLDKAEVALVSVVVAFPSVLDRSEPFTHGGERDGPGDAPADMHPTTC